MRKFTLLLSALGLAAAANAQTVATFESLSLPGSDTFYVNYTASGTDVGFDNGLAHFPCIYDTAFGGYWSGGFSYSNMTDSVTSGYTNGYSAKTAIGYAASSQYAVAYGAENMVHLIGAAAGQSVRGFYVTNGTYAYNSMRDGDFVGKQFGGTSGTDADWFKLVVRGYSGGVIGTDSVEFYLADYRFADSDSDYIVKTWQWMNLLPLGNADSLAFKLSSSDVGSFGMNTPAYFAIDNFTTNEVALAAGTTTALAAKVYPTMVTTELSIDLQDDKVEQIVITDMAGRTVHTIKTPSMHTVVNTTAMQNGMYVLHIVAAGKTATVKFVKQ